MPEKVSILGILLTVGGFLVSGLIGTIIFFLKRTLNAQTEKVEKLENKLSQMDAEFSRYKIEVEREYLSLVTWREWRADFAQWQTNLRTDIKEIFNKLELISGRVGGLGR